MYNFISIFFFFNLSKTKIMSKQSIFIKEKSHFVPDYNKYLMRDDLLVIKMHSKSNKWIILCIKN